MIALTIHSSVNSSNGSSGNFITSMIDQLHPLAKLITLGGTSVISVSLGSKFAEKCEKKITKKQKSGLKAAGYASATAVLSTIAYQGVKSSIPFIQKNGLSVINNANSADMLTILFAIAAIIGTTYCADKTAENIKETFFDKKVKDKN